MKRDVDRLSNKIYDLLVIGGGIYGSTVAWDAASRGLSVALLDKGDFGGKTSSNSQKIIHGGLRYIQHGDISRMRESIRERVNMMRIAPHLVHPMPCLIPTYGRFMRYAMFLAMNIYDILSLDIKNLKDPQKHIPRGKIISKEECLRMVPGIKKEELTGGVIWYDAQVYNTERMVLSYIQSAEKAGADVANYVEVVGFLKNGSRIEGVKTRDSLDGTEREVRAKIVLNASGPWVDQVLDLVETHDCRILLSKMMILVVDRQFAKNYAFGIPFKTKYKDDDAIVNKNYRFLFITPWRGYSLVGAMQQLYCGSPDYYKVNEDDIQNFIEEVNNALPYASLTRKDVSFYYGGLLPIDKVNPDGDIKVTKRYKILDHEVEGINGLISIVGVKYTTARDVASKVTDLIFKKLEKKPPKCTTMETQIHGGEIVEFNDFIENAIENRPHELSEDIIRHLVYNYGSEYINILKYIDENPILGQRITDNSYVIKGEILHGIREEMAQKLSDVVLRRTELGTAGHPGEECLKTCADIMAKELGWNKVKIQEELKDVRKIYAV
ncbi:MAG: glycerol-3-phosphate dehydrogenase/oxidase [Methanosarcinales archaeon]|nr:glycerol-3-phosphate dehydrogenase/oxidase [Methanosarcinales archaeon]